MALAIGVIASNPARAAGECEKIKDPSERMTCIEQKVDAIKLQGIHILSANRPGQCLAWVDNNAAPHTTGCNNDNADFRWNIQPN